MTCATRTRETHCDLARNAFIRLHTLLRGALMRTVTSKGAAFRSQGRTYIEPLTMYNTRLHYVWSFRPAAAATSLRWPCARHYDSEETHNTSGTYELRTT